MNIFSEPDWVLNNVLAYQLSPNISTNTFHEINKKLESLQRGEPIVSVVIPAWNEESNVLSCIASIANTETHLPIEIIVVNNNSTDNTQNILDRLHVKTLQQSIVGCGPARQMGQENAKGKYILLADADCIYPKLWINKMVESLQSANVVCVYGRYSFISEKGYPRWKLFFWESLKDIIAEIRHCKRPFLNCYGMSMGYLRDLGLKVGFVDHNIRGEDGRLCFDLMTFGKVKQVKSGLARVWTKPRTLQQEGSLSRSLVKRIKKELLRLNSMFTRLAPHNTKISEN